MFVSPSHADKLEGGGYTLYDVINSGGLTLQGGEYTLQDSKGEALGGKSTGGEYTFVSGLFGLIGGIKIGDAPWGTVPLTIERDGDNIKITWDAKLAPGAKIYVLTGDGTGQFQKININDWKLYTDTSIASQFDAKGVTTGTLLHKGQVGSAAQSGITNHPEAYYFGLQAAITPQTICQDPDPLYKGKPCFQVAPAVGKVNMALGGSIPEEGKNLVAIPFLCQQSPALKDVLGEGTGTVWAEGDKVQFKIAPSPSFRTAVYQGAKWVDASTGNVPGPLFDVDYKFGNIIITKAAKKLTYVGAVVNSDVAVSVYSGANEAPGGKTLLGMVYPVSVQLSNSGLIADGAVNGDIIQYKLTPIGEAYRSAIVAGGQWKSASSGGAPESDIATLIVPNSYVFVRYATTGFNWNRKKPN